MIDMKGIIIRGIGGFYYVKTEDGTVYECKARGIFRKENIKPCIGDNVEILADGGKGSIEKIFERSSFLIRPPVANIDTLVIVAAAAEPDPNVFLIDKLTVNAEEAGITPVIAVNKTDLKSGNELCAVYRKAGYETFEVSAERNEGTEKLISVLRGKTSAFAGLSGVGKSTLLNMLTGNCMETGSVSEKIKRGRHTTRHVELLELPFGGFVLDTPGFSSFEVNRIKAAELYKYFPEMREIGDCCRFKGCSHINEPDCEVKKRLFDGKIAESRYESYKELYNKLKNINDWEK